jgi:hypothetical protein
LHGFCWRCVRHLIGNTNSKFWTWWFFHILFDFLERSAFITNRSSTFPRWLVGVASVVWRALRAVLDSTWATFLESRREFNSLRQSYFVSFKRLFCLRLQTTDEIPGRVWKSIVFYVMHFLITCFRRVQIRRMVLHFDVINILPLNSRQSIWIMLVRVMIFRTLT